MRAMFETIASLPIALWSGREALRLPADAGLPAPCVRLDRVCRARSAPGEVWNEPRDPIVRALRLIGASRKKAKRWFAQERPDAVVGFGVLCL